ncbi:MAG TPA: diacylglycerol kinase family protein [Actinomycetes bacterium]
MASMEAQQRAVPVWIVLFDRLVARWLFAFIALSALGLGLLAALSHGWVHLVLSLPGHLLAAVVAGTVALLTRSSTRRRSATTCLLGDVVAVVPNLFGVGGQQWRGLLTCVLLLPMFAPATRRALGSEPVDAVAGDVPPTPEVVAARSDVAAQVPAAQVHDFQRPVLLLNPRSGSVQAIRGQLLEAAGRYGVGVREAATPTGLVALAREAVAGGADVLGVAGGDGSLAAVAAVAIEAGLPFVCVPAGTRNHFARDVGLDRTDPATAIEAFVAGPERRVDVATVGGRLFLNNAAIGVYAALVHEPSYRDDWLGALGGVLENVLERDALPVPVSFRDGSGNHWDEVLILFVSNNAYPLTGLGGRPRLDAGTLEVSALRRTEGQELGRALENLFNSRYQAGQGWARWTAASLEVDSPSGRLEVGIDGEPVELDTPVEFKVHAGALRVLLPTSRPATGRPSPSRSPAPRRRVLAIASTPEGRAAQVAGLVRLGRLLGRVGEREFGPARDEHGRPVAPRRQRRPGP